ncbi:MAG TPA: alpha/beta hydrolase [Nocardioidaceae bacterium]|nr:alpha/beta hydrolase [Nocardioidaceae bacterium]
MSTYVLVHGGGGSAWDWHLVTAELRVRGNEVIAPDLPCDDPRAGWEDYAEAVVAAVPTELLEQRSGLVLVAHSLGSFTAPLACERLRPDLLVLVAPMVPAPGESAAQWWESTGHAEAQEARARAEGWSVDGGVEEIFLHDVPPDLAAEALSRARDESSAAFTAPWPLAGWPDVPTRVLLAADDRIFPLDFSRRLVRQRLGLKADDLPGGHYLAVSRSRELADRLEEYADEVLGTRD